MAGCLYLRGLSLPLAWPSPKGKYKALIPYAARPSWSRRGVFASLFARRALPNAFCFSLTRIPPQASGNAWAVPGLCLGDAGAVETRRWIFFSPARGAVVGHPDEAVRGGSG